MTDPSKYISKLPTGSTTVPGLTLEITPVGESEETDLQAFLEELEARVTALEA